MATMRGDEGILLNSIRVCKVSQGDSSFKAVSTAVELCSKSGKQIASASVALLISSKTACTGV
jgi:hypothetical protein